MTKKKDIIFIDTSLTDNEKKVKKNSLHIHNKTKNIHDFTPKESRKYLHQARNNFPSPSKERLIFTPYLLYRRIDRISHSLTNPSFFLPSIFPNSWNIIGRFSGEDGQIRF